MTLSQRAVEAAVKANLHPSAEPSEVELRNMRRALDAALAVDGVALVPREPSMAMLAAGQKAWNDDPLKKSSTLYRAMIAAASDGEERK